MVQRTKKLCSVDGCNKTHYGRGWCQKHYSRWRKNGDPLIKSTTVLPPKDAIRAYVAEQGDCLVWTRSKFASGYGLIWVNNRNTPTHRYAWELVNGPIPEGMELDHICWNRACLRIEHLRLATLSQNSANRMHGVQNQSGHRNVFKNGNKWKVVINYQGEKRYFGTFETIAGAALVARRARRELFGEFAGKDVLIKQKIGADDD